MCTSAMHCQRALKSLLEWMAQIWSSTLTDWADVHTFHANAPAPLPLGNSPQDCQGSQDAVERACGQHWVVLSFSAYMTVFMPTVCRCAPQLSGAATPSPPQAGAVSTRGGRVHRCAVHMEGATSTVTATLESRCQCRKSRWQRNSSQRELDLQWILTLEKFFQAKRDSNWKKKKKLRYLWLKLLSTFPPDTGWYQIQEEF